MKIDIFCHVMPRRYADRIGGLNLPLAANLRNRWAAIPCLWDMGERFRIMDEFGEYSQIPSLAAPPCEAFEAAGPELARMANDEMAELVSRHPDRFLGFVASISLNDVEATVTEVDRAVNDLGAVGVQVFTNVSGAPLDHPRFVPFFEKMVEVDRPIWIHPTRTSAWPDYLDEAKSRYEIWWLFGWPYETAVCMARIVFSGLLERYQSLTFIAHHGGSMVPYFEGRVGAGMDLLGTRTPEAERELLGEANQLTRRPLDYFKSFYVDTALFGARAALQCSLEFFGEDKMMFASDMPYDPEKGPGYIRETVSNLDDLDITPQAREKIYERNARALLRLCSASRDRREGV